MATATNVPLVLICGDDEFSVKQRARSLYHQWCGSGAGMDNEMIEAGAANTDEALRIIGRLLQSLQTLPFFGGDKVVWFKDCNFFGEDRVSNAAAVGNAVTELAQILKDFKWQGVRLVISAGKVDRRKTFFKTVEKVGKVEVCEALSLASKDWADKAEAFVVQELRNRGKEIAPDALSEMVQSVGPSLQQLNSEAEKLSLYVADRKRVEAADVAAIVAKQKHARAFALADAVGDRNLPKFLRTLDEELWAMQFDKEKSEIGMLYGMISKIRAMLFAKELAREGLLRLERDFQRFKGQVERLPAARFADDKKFSPLGINAFVLFRALQQSENFTRDELVRAMELLLEANLKLVSSKLDGAMVLQQTLSQIIGVEPRPRAGGR